MLVLILVLYQFFYLDCLGLKMYKMRVILFLIEIFENVFKFSIVIAMMMFIIMIIIIIAINKTR